MLIGIDWGGTKIEGVAMTEAGLERLRLREDTPRGDYDGCLATIARLVANGHGYTILSKPAVRDELADGRLSFARLGNGALRRTLSLVRNPAQVVTHASARVEDLTIKIMASLINKGVWEADPEAALG